MACWCEQKLGGVRLRESERARVSRLPTDRRDSRLAAHGSHGWRATRSKPSYCFTTTMSWRLTWRYELNPEHQKLVRELVFGCKLFRYLIRTISTAFYFSLSLFASSPFSTVPLSSIGTPDTRYLIMLNASGFCARIIPCFYNSHNVLCWHFGTI